MSIDMSDYKEVSERIADFREKHPDGSLRPVNPEQPYSLEFIKVGDDDKCFVVYSAAAYRTADDPCPGIGVAWEPFPGLTPYTKNSELMNAETSAWGRAIIAVGASDAKKIATKEDVDRRRAEDGQETPAASKGPDTRLATEAQLKKAFAMRKTLGLSQESYDRQLSEHYNKTSDVQLTRSEIDDLFKRLQSAIDAKAKDSKPVTEADFAAEAAFADNDTDPCPF